MFIVSTACAKTHSCGNQPFMGIFQVWDYRSQLPFCPVSFRKAASVFTDFAVFWTSPGGFLFLLHWKIEILKSVKIELWGLWIILGKWYKQNHTEKLRFTALPRMSFCLLRPRVCLVLAPEKKSASRLITSRLMCFELQTCPQKGALVSCPVLKNRWKQAWPHLATYFSETLHTVPSIRFDAGVC